MSASALRELPPGTDSVDRGTEAGIELQRTTTITAMGKSESGYQVSVKHPASL